MNTLLLDNKKAYVFLIFVSQHVIKYKDQMMSKRYDSYKIFKKWVADTLWKKY